MSRQRDTGSLGRARLRRVAARIILAMCVSLVFAAFSLPAPAHAADQKEPSPAAKPANGAKGKDAAKDGEKKDEKKDGDGSLKKLLGGDKKTGQPPGPLLIKSDNMSLNSKTRVFVYSGNVELVRDELTITSNILEGQYDENNKIQTVLCKENVVITKGDTLRATSNRALYKVNEGTIILTENPEVVNQGNALAADKITVFIDQDRSEAEGNVHVRVLKSDEIAPHASQ